MHGSKLAGAIAVSLISALPGSSPRATPAAPPGTSAGAPPRSEDPSLLQLPDGRILFIGTQAGLYDAASQGFQPVDIPYREGRVATLLPSGDVLLTGGADPKEGSRRVELYETRTGKRRTVGALEHPHAVHTVTWLPGGQLLVLGGRSEIYDPVRHLARPAAPMLVSSRKRHTATRLADGRVLVVGGLEGPDDGLPPRRHSAWFFDSAELYDPARDHFKPAGRMSAGRAGHSATLLEDRMVLIAGGGGGERTAEIYDPATGTWRATGGMSFSHSFHAALPLPGGYVQILGADTCNPWQGWGCKTHSSEIYDPRSGTWSFGVPTERCYSEAHALLMTGGQLLLVGTSGSAAAPATERLPIGTCYDPLPGLPVRSCPSGIPWEPSAAPRVLRSPALSPEPEVACRIRRIVAGGPPEHMLIPLSLYASRATTSPILKQDMEALPGEWLLSLPPGPIERLHLSYSSPYLQLAGYVLGRDIPLRPIKYEVFGGFARPRPGAPYETRGAKDGRIQIALKLDDFVESGENGWLTQELPCASMGIRTPGSDELQEHYDLAAFPGARPGSLSIQGETSLPLARTPGGPAVARLSKAAKLLHFYEKRSGWFRISVQGTYATYFGWVPASRVEQRRILPGYRASAPEVIPGTASRSSGPPPLRLRCPHPIPLSVMDEDEQLIELGNTRPGVTLQINRNHRNSSECAGPRQLRSLSAMGAFVPVRIAEQPFSPEVRFGSLFAPKTELLRCTQLPD